MTHCTVCGAAAREGAKFCTSCGARLVDTVTAPATEPVEAGPAAAAEPDATDTPAQPEAEQQAEASAWAPADSSSATGEDDSSSANGADTPEPEVPETVVSETEATVSPEYSASWPTGESEAAEPVSAAPVSDATASDVPAADAESTWSSWSSTNDETGTGTSDDTRVVGAPASFATDADQDARSDESRETNAVAAESDADEAPAAEPETSDPMEESHHGASAWESWAPEASGGATVAASSGDVGSSVRRLLDDLANRIDRLIDPAKVDTRGVDADELADQLDRWSNASTDADGLLEVVRAVRTSPRDVDALTRLADRAPDLELLVRHYQAITGSAGEWASKLRDAKASEPDA